MPKRRRFKVESLAEARAGEPRELPAAERRHAGVLRLRAGDEVELFDGAGRAWLAELAAGAAGAILQRPLTEAQAPGTLSRPSLPVILATAWPKGKRAALLVEKCTELGVSSIVPLSCARSVVTKRDSPAAWTRFRRIAAEAAKQSGRREVPELSAERAFAQALEEAAGRRAILLDGRAEPSLAKLLASLAGAPAWGPQHPLVLFVGPEGGFTSQELELAARAGVQRARLAPHVLRVETACIAACAVCAAWGA